MMGILPDVAANLHISIEQAGHFISAYALGVCCGAPALILARRFPLKHILLALVSVVIAGNLFATAASGYWTLLTARFISGLPHGAYFGVASIVAEKLADKGKGSEAVSIMIAGMTVANLFGVPLGTSLSAMISWRVTFLIVGCWGLVMLYYIWRWVPHVKGVKDTGFKGQFRFLRKPAPWLILGATALGNGGVFCWYSYVTPMLIHISGFSPASMTALMMLAGFGMVVGNLTSGRLSDRYTPGRVGATVQGMICIILLLIFFPGAASLVRRVIDGLLYSLPVRRVESGTGLHHPGCGRGRNVRSCLRTGRLQPRKRYRSLLRRKGSALGVSIPRPDRGTPCVGRFYPPYTIL